MSNRTCEFSPCRKYRYTLWREWYGMRAISPELIPVDGNQALHYLMVIGLNPSTADETKDDPTIRRCIGFAKRWGFGALCMTNLFAWRDTDPKGMKRAVNPIGDDNDRWLSEMADNAGFILAAWGKHGEFLARDKAVIGNLENMGRKLHCLGRNGDGTPKHPLYIPANTQPVTFTK